MEGGAMIRGLFVLCMAWWVAEAQDCQPLDPISGSALTVQIPEADDQTLLSNNPDFYRKQIRIGGTYNFGVNLQLSQGTAAFNPNTYFAFSTATNSNTGIYIRLIQPVDRDGNAFNVQRVGNSETFSLTCTTNTGTTRTYSLVVQFVDQNDNSPIFQNTPYSVTVNELTPIGLTVYQQITATDADQSNNGQITYSLLAGDGTINDGSRFFAINPTTGVLTVKETLDYEGLSNLNKLYSIQVQATDNPINTAERRTSSQFLSVTITDGDDLGPAFEYSSCFRYSGYCFDPRYTSSITSTSLNTQLVVFPYPPQTPFNQPVTVQARDKDTLNAPIVFDIETTVPSGYASFFSVQTQQQTGSNFYSAFITQTQSINRASVGGKLELILRASEETGHKRSTRATIDVTVSGTNDFDPVVTSSSGNFIGTISEDADAGTPLRAQGSTDAIQLVVTDQDVLPGDPDPTYFFVPDTNLFTVNGKGFISLVSAGSLDFETNSQFTFTVVVREANTVERRSATATMTVNVINANDNVPVFPAAAYQSTISAGGYTPSNGVTVATVQATDADTGIFGQVSYSITAVSNSKNANDNAISKFRISGSLGVVECIGSVSGDEQYTITVRAADGGTGLDQRQEEMYQHLMTGYEAKQKELLVENNELRTSLAHVHRDISKALGLSHHLTSHSTKVTTSPDSESCSSDEESNYPSVTDCSSNDIDGYFQMPYDMIRENLENMFKERLKRLKERKKRKLPSPTKSTKSSPSRLSTAKPYDMEQFKTEMEILKRQIKTYEEQIERHKREKENYKEVIQQQEDMIQNSIQTHKHQNSGEIFLDDSKLVQEKESLLEQKKLFHEEKTNFLEERKQFTEAAIKLGKERRALEEEKTTILKNQFLQISPFRSPTEKSTPQKDSVRLLPSTPLFSPAPSGQPKTPSTVELFRFLGITPQEQFLQHKNSTLDDSSSELKRSHSSEYLNNSTMTNSAHNDLSLFAGQLDSARKTLFHRRSSTGSNEDLGV